MKKCKECNIEKDLSEFYTHPQGVQGTLPRCKECIRKGRKSDREREMARKNDRKRSRSPERIAYAAEQTKKFRMRNPEKWNAHKLVNNFIRNNKEYKPKNCVKCGAHGLLNYHHFDYSLPNHVVPCCHLCHSSFHKGFAIDNSWITILPF